jgi:hypothetical protein
VSSATKSSAEEYGESRPETQLRVSAYDNVASLLISLLVLVGVAVLLLFIIWLTSRLLFTQTAIPVELLEYAGRGDHAAGFERDPEEPGLEELEDMYEPQVEASLEAVTDLVSTQAASFDAIANAAAASSKGSGMGDSRGPGPLGEGSSDIIPPWDRWEIRFTTSGIDAYARQLDHFKIELGAVGGGKPTVDYAYNLSKGKPDRRTGKPDEEKRLYMTWQQGTSPLAAYDRQLIGRAGIATQRRLIMQFYPRETELQLLRLEVENAKGRDPREFLKTIFGVRPGGSGFEFYVIEQYFRPAPSF